MRPEDLLRLREDIQFETSSASVGERNIELGAGFLRNEEKCFEASGIFSLIFAAIEAKYSLMKEFEMIEGQ